MTTTRRVMAAVWVILLVASTVARPSFRQLGQSDCSWSRARDGFKWQESETEGCKMCKCVETRRSLWQICTTNPRPTGWTDNCRMKRVGCKYEVVHRLLPNKRCKVLAYTTYRYKMWVDDR